MNRSLPLLAERGELIQDAEQLVSSYPKTALTVDCVIFGFEENELKVLLIRSDLEAYKGLWTILGDVVHGGEDLGDAAYRVLRERTGLNDIFLEQVQTFSSPGRHPGGRVTTVAYYSLINIRHHRLRKLDNEVHWQNLDSIQEMGFDHKGIMEVCHQRLQRRIQEHPLGFNLLPDKFSLRELQNLYEAILDIKLDRRNFRKKFFSMDFLIDTEEYEVDVPHRPGKLYQFNFQKYQRNQKKWFGIDF
jgi:8-oxo-dGTP diphosphatase